MHCFAIADAFGLERTLSPEEKLARDAAARFTDERWMPLAAEAFDRGRFPTELVPELAVLGFLGATIAGYGSASATAYGLILAELERGDSGLRSFCSVTTSLCMWPIDAFGSEEQKARWLPAMARGEAIGCFGLTEPSSGSDPASMRTVARADGSDYVLDGEKAWVTNGALADVALIWARVPRFGDGPRAIRCFLVEKGAFSAREIERKYSLRASSTASLRLDGARVPASAMLPGAEGLGAALKCLNNARAGIAFGVTGAAAACFQAARDYARERVQFGKPIGAFQLVQEKLAEMYTQLSLAQLVAVRTARMKEEGTLTPLQVSLAKRHNVDAALAVARTARELLGANGITLVYPPIRHLLNLETVKTYEGTHDIHTLVVGKELTGLDAFGR